MSDTVSSAEFDRQDVELLPARTVLSMFSATDGATDGLAFDQLAQGALGLVTGGGGAMSSGADGSNDGGDREAGNS